MLTVVLAILAKLVVILKLGLRNISKRITSHIFLNIYIPQQHALTLCFKIIDKANSKFDLKIKEACKCKIKSFSSHPFTIPSILPCSFLSFFFFAFLFHLLFLLSLTLIGIIYCLNYTSLLLHLVTTHLLSHPFLSSIIFIISTLNIGIFYCLNYTSLLLYLIITDFVVDFIITM